MSTDSARRFADQIKFDQDVLKKRIEAAYMDARTFNAMLRQPAETFNTETTPMQTQIVNQHATREQTLEQEQQFAREQADRLAADNAARDKRVADLRAAEKAHDAKMQAERAAAIETAAKGTLRMGFAGTDAQFEAQWPTLFAEWQRGEALRRAGEIVSAKRAEYAGLI